MKKLTLILVVLLTICLTAPVYSQKDSLVVKNTIRVENANKTFKVWFIQTRNKVYNLPIPTWWNLIITNDGNTDFDAGWNPTVRVGKLTAIFWVMGGANFNSSDLHINSHKLDLFAVEKIGKFFFDQEWIYYTATYKNWFRTLGYWNGVGLQATGTVQQDKWNLTAGPRLKVAHGKNNLEVYFGLIGSKDAKNPFTGWNRQVRLFWLRYTISL